MNYVISGKVIKGDGYGKKIGYPTVNLETENQKLPEDGVYTGVGTLDNIKYRAGIIIGPNNKVEVYLIGYEGDAYGKMVTLEINKYLREFKKFDTEEELINQIKKDIELCKEN